MLHTCPTAAGLSVQNMIQQPCLRKHETPTVSLFLTVCFLNFRLSMMNSVKTNDLNFFLLAFLFFLLIDLAIPKGQQNQEEGMQETGKILINLKDSLIILFGRVLILPCLGLSSPLFYSVNKIKILKKTKPGAVSDLITDSRSRHCQSANS